MEVEWVTPKRHPPFRGNSSPDAADDTSNPTPFSTCNRHSYPAPILHNRQFMTKSLTPRTETSHLPHFIHQ